MVWGTRFCGGARSWGHYKEEVDVAAAADLFKKTHGCLGSFIGRCPSANVSLGPLGPRK